MKRIACACLVVALIPLPGCSKPTGPHTVRVWGDVSYDGKPIEEGSIDFLAPDGSTPAQAQIKEGHYDLPAEAGPLADKTYNVQINALKKTGKTIPNLMGDDGSATMDVMVNIIPAKYNTKSDLKANVSSDTSKNQFDFKLEKAGGAK